MTAAIQMMMSTYKAAASGAPPALRGSASSGAGAPATRTVPAGVVNGDYLIAIQFSFVAPILNAAFTSMGTFTGGDAGSYLISYRKCNSEPATYDFDGSNSNMGTILFAVSGMDGTTPFENYAAATKVSTSPFSPADIVSTLNNCMLITFFIDDEATRTITSGPAGATLVNEFSNGSVHGAVYVKTFPASGTLDPGDLTWSSATYGGCAAVVARSATP